MGCPSYPAGGVYGAGPAERRGLDDARLADLEVADGFEGGQVPETNRAAVGAAGQDLAVRTECYGADDSGLAGQGTADGLAGPTS
jgi:hypothetical protein